MKEKTLSNGDKKRGRKKMTVYDRNDKYNYAIYNMLEKYAKTGNKHDILRELTKIRSQTLKELLCFWLNKLDDPFFPFELSEKELAKKFGVSERKVYDLIKTCCIISNMSDVAFNNMEIILSRGDIR